MDKKEDRVVVIVVRKYCADSRYKRAAYVTMDRQGDHVGLPTPRKGREGFKSEGGGIVMKCS